MKRSGDLPMVKQPGRGRTRTQSPAHPTPEPVLRGNNGVRAHLEEGGSESPEELRPGMVGLTLQVVKTRASLRSSLRVASSSGVVLLVPGII